MNLHNIASCAIIMRMMISYGGSPMNVNFAFRGFEEHSNTLKQYAEKRLTKVTKLLDMNTMIDVVFTKDTHEKKTEIKVNHKGVDFLASDVHGDFDASIDLCIGKLHRQIVRDKDRKVGQRRS